MEGKLRSGGGLMRGRVFMNETVPSEKSMSNNISALPFSGYNEMSDYQARRHLPKAARTAILILQWSVTKTR